MDRLRCIAVFVEVAERGSFTAAATRLRMSKAAVTNHIASLEHDFQARLLNRTSKQVTLTQEGQSALSRCKTLLDTYQDISDDIRNARQVPSGTVRVGTPPAFGTRFLLPAIGQFTKVCPNVQVVVALFDGHTRSIGQDLDLVIRFGSDEMGPSAKSVAIASLPQVIVAAPSYLRAEGVPQTVSDLGKRNCLINVQKSPTGIWQFTSGLSIRVQGSICSDLGDALKQATILGYGISMFPYYFVEEEVRDGRLAIVLPEQVPTPLIFSLSYAADRGIPLRLRRFVEFLEHWSQINPDWGNARAALPWQRARTVTSADQVAGTPAASA